MCNAMTENMLNETKKYFENLLNTKYDFLQQRTKDDLLADHLESIRNAFIVHTVVPHSFPAGIVGDDYYGSDGNGNEVLPRMDSIPNQSGTDGDS